MNLVVDAFQAMCSTLGENILNILRKVHDRSTCSNLLSTLLIVHSHFFQDDALGHGRSTQGIRLHGGDRVRLVVVLLNKMTSTDQKEQHNTRAILVQSSFIDVPLNIHEQNAQSTS